MGRRAEFGRPSASEVAEPKFRVVRDPFLTPRAASRCAICVIQVVNYSPNFARRNAIIVRTTSLEASLSSTKSNMWGPVA